MTSATYPNHAPFATGAGPVGHRLPANWVVTAGGPQPAHMVGPAVPTLIEVFDGPTAAVVGDQHLVGVMRLETADVHWPVAGALDGDIARDARGYAADAE